MANKRKKNGNLFTGRQIMFILAVIFILSAVGIPFLINRIYMAGESVEHPIITMLSASDLLSYSGAILSGALAIAGVFFTVKYSQTQYKEDMLNRVLPYLTVELISSSYSGDLFEEVAMDIAENVFKPHISKTVYEKQEIKECTVSNVIYFMVREKLSIKHHLEEFDKKLCIDGLSYETNGQRVICMSEKNKSFFSFNLINSGNGPAANLIITLSQNDEKISTAMFPLHVSQKVYIALCVDSAAPRGKYKLRFEYKNIYGDRYVKEQHLVIEENRGTLDMELYDKPSRRGE